MCKGSAEGENASTAVGGEKRPVRPGQRDCVRGTGWQGPDLQGLAGT